MKKKDWMKIGAVCMLGWTSATLPLAAQEPFQEQSQELAQAVKPTQGQQLKAVDQREKSKEEKEETVFQKLESKDYEILVTTALPARSHSISLSTSFSLGVRNDSVCSQLPYFGRAYRIPYGGGDGLNFRAPLKNYKVKEGKKGSKRIQFTATTPEDIFNYRIEVYRNGNCFIDVHMQNRESIHFIGYLQLDNSRKK